MMTMLLLAADDDDEFGTFDFQKSTRFPAL